MTYLWLCLIALMPYTMVIGEKNKDPTRKPPLAARGSFPYTGTIQKLYGITYVTICAGAIVKEDWIMSTVACIGEQKNQKKYLRAVGGAYSLWDQWFGNCQFSNIKEIKQLETTMSALLKKINLGSLLDTDNLAFAQLETPFIFNRYVNRIEIATNNQLGAAVMPSWGRLSGTIGSMFRFLTFYLPTTYLKVYEFKLTVCKNNDVTNGCAQLADSTLYYEPCDGDQGSPIVINNKLVGFLQAQSTEACVQNHIDDLVFTKVVNFLEDIDRIVHPQKSAPIVYT